MRIDIGPQGRIIGTKRVDAQGQLRGLDAYAEKEVVLVVPDGRASFHLTLGDHLHEWEQLARRGSRMALKEIRAFRRKVPDVEAILADARKQWKDFKVTDLVPSRAEAEREVRRQIAVLRKDERVRAAEKWIRARIPGAAKPAPRAKRARKTA